MIKAPFGQGGMMVARIEWTRASDQLFICKWVSNPKVFDSLQDGTKMSLQPYIKMLAENEVRTFFEAKGKLDRNLAGLKSVYGLATKLVNMENPQEGIEIRKHPEGHLHGICDPEDEEPAKKMLQQFLIQSRFPGLASGKAAASGKDLVFRVDTFKLDGKIRINEIDVWPIAMEFLDDLYIDDDKMQQFARKLASFVQNNWFTWPL